MKRHVFAAVFGAILVALPVSQALRADSARYTVEDLGTLADGSVPTVTGMNAAGQMSGYVVQPSSGMPRAVRFDGTAWSYVPDVSTFYSVAWGINEHGDLVGYHFDGAAFRAFRYMSGPGLSSIDPLPGGFVILGLAIDPDGTVFGQSESENGNVGFRAPVNGPAAALTELASGWSKACGVNAAGQIVGYRLTELGQQAFRIEQNGSVTDIPFAGTAPNAEACAINATGRVGGKTDVDGTQRAFTFEAGAPVNVDAFAASESKVEAIAGGVSVGWFTSTADGGVHAFVNSTEGSADLNTIIAPGTGWTLDQAFAVNAQGHIAGIGTLDGRRRAFRLKPVAGDNTAPTITSVTATPGVVQVPNNAMVPVTVAVAVTDDRDPSPVCSLTGIDGHGAAAGDFSVTGALSGSVRATGGATYSFAVSCVDGTGNATPGSVDVVVLRDTAAPVIASVTADPSTIAPPDGALVPVTVKVSATDNVDAAPTCALNSISSTAVTADDSAITGPLTAKVRAVGDRTYTLTVKCSDTARNQSFAAVAVVVPGDKTAPVISSVVATPGLIWPPNGKMVPVSVSVRATDNLDAAPQCSLTSISSNGGPAGDAVITGAFTAQVRADKQADGSSRIYTLKVTCVDGAGNKAFCSTTVVVSKDNATANAAVKALLAKKVVLAQLKKAAAVKQALKRAAAYFSRGSSR